MNEAKLARKPKWASDVFLACDLPVIFQYLCYSILIFLET